MVKEDLMRRSRESESCYFLSLAYAFIIVIYSLQILRRNLFKLLVYFKLKLNNIGKKWILTPVSDHMQKLISDES